MPTLVRPLQGGTGVANANASTLTLNGANSVATWTNSGLTAGRIVFSGTAGLEADSASLLYDDTNKRLQIGSGTTTSVGGLLGYYGATGIGSLWLGGTAASFNNNNFGIAGSTTFTQLNAPSGGSVFIGVDATTKITQTGTAGAGPSLTAGTATTDVAAMSITRTNNNAAVATGVKWTFTDTTSAAGFLAFQILGGAAGTTNLISVSKAGLVDAPAYSAAGSAGVDFGPSVVTSITVKKGIIIAIS